MHFRKIIALLLALSLSATVFASCGKKDESIPSGMQYAANTADYKFFIPTSWTIDSKNPTDTFIAKASDNSTVSIQKMPFDSDFLSADHYFQTHYLPSLSATFAKVELLETSIENQTFGKEGTAAARYRYSLESDKSSYHVLQYFCVYKGDLYIMTYNAEQSVFDKHLEDVISIANNFVCIKNENSAETSDTLNKITSAEDPTVPEGMQLITSEFLDSKLFVPIDWTPMTAGGTLIAKAEDGSNISLQKMTPSGSFRDANDYFTNDYLPKITSTYQNVTIMDESGNVLETPAGKTISFGTPKVGAAQYFYTVKSDGATYKITQFLSIYAGYLYILTYTAEESLFDQHMAEVSSIIDHFKY